MDKENILLSSKPIEISEYKNYKLATFLISVLDEYDLNGRMIPKEVGEMYHQTIVGFPILAKLITDSNGEPMDFRGHEMYIIQDKNGNKEAKFNTMPIGSVLSSWIEERYVEGYDGLKSCIMIQAKLWSSRFPEYFTVLDKLWAENNVNSSWELSVDSFERTPRGKILKVFSFVGNCILGKSILGAVPKAGVLEYAELKEVESFESEELELAKALSLDTIQNSNINDLEKEDNQLAKPESKEIAEEIIETVPEVVVEPEQTEVAPVDVTVEETPIVETPVVSTENEVSELDVLTSQISELNATIASLNTEVETKNGALVEASKTIQSLHVTIAELNPFKEKFMQDEKERIEAETLAKKEDLKATALATNLITKEDLETSEFKDLINSLNEKDLNQIIATRLIASLSKKETQETKTETASVKEVIAVASLVNDETEIDTKSIMKNYIGGRK